MRVALSALVPLVVVAGCTSGGRHVQDACGSKQLGVFAITQGGGGATIGSLQLRNDGSADCWLRGRADLAILNGGGHPLAIRVLPPNRSTMRLRPHSAGEVVFQWHNWCRLTAPVALKLVLPEGGGTIETKADIGRPRCDEPKAASTLVVSTFGAAT
jgi:Protein of unknown function (DUF4232)